MKSLAFIGIEFILEEPCEMLFEEDYITGHPQFRYPGGLPRRCPACRAWMQRILRINEKEARKLETMPGGSNLRKAAVSN